MDLVFSDIHADIDALQTILQVATSNDFTKRYGKFSRILNLGDVLERGTHPKQVLDKKNGLFCVHGGPLDPQKITPKNTYDESWLYQRSWQRLSEEDFEYFSYYGYHYKASSAFTETKNHLSSSVILCGHQHTETA